MAWTEKMSPEKIYNLLSVKENYYMSHCKHLVARNLGTLLSAFIKDQNDLQAKAKLDECLELIRKSGAADEYFKQTVSPIKNAAFYRQVIEDDLKRSAKAEGPASDLTKAQVAESQRILDERRKNTRK